MYLCDSAKETISGLLQTPTNYNTAVELLKKCYGNTQALISSFMNKFLMLEKIKNKDIKVLQKLLDQTVSSIRNLQSLHVETSSYGTLLVLLINDKLTDNLRISVAKNFENEVWDIEGLIYFLRNEVEVKEHSLAMSSSFYDYTEHDYDKKAAFSSSALHTQQHKLVYKSKCVFCEKTNHTSNMCLNITALVTRKESVKQKQLFCLLRNRSFSRNMQVKVCL